MKVSTWALGPSGRPFAANRRCGLPSLLLTRKQLAEHGAPLSYRSRGDAFGGRVNCQVRCDFTVGHSLAMML